MLLLAGRAWLVTHVDWTRRRCVVEATDLPGLARWGGLGGGLSFEITRGMRDVVLGVDPSGVRLSRRANAVLADLRATRACQVADESTVLCNDTDGDLLWWTWAGTVANRTLHASLPGVVDPRQRIGDQLIRLRPGDALSEASGALDASAAVPLTSPQVDDPAVRGLKFSSALPPELAIATVAERLGDPVRARAVLVEPRASRSGL